MGVKIKQRPQRPERRTVEIPGLEGCSLTVREPTRPERYAQYLHAARVVPTSRGINGKPERDADLWEASIWDFRLRVIVDWAGFETEDAEGKPKPLPFTADNLRLAMEQFDAVESTAIKAANESFFGIEAIAEKNFEAPLSSGSPVQEPTIPTP